LSGWFSFRFQPKTKEELDLIRFVIRQLGYRPENIQLFREALTHKSISNNTGGSSNERLEFLGDAILDAVIAEYLYTKFPNEDEGYLTKLKSKVVSRQTLGGIAESIGVENHIIYQKGRAIKLSTLEGNAFEALIGAIYLDGGFEAVKRTIYHHVFRLHVDLSSLLEKEIDFKSRLFIWAQKNKLDIEFNVLEESSVNGSWRYEIEITINKQPYGRGVGESKKIAEQGAARETLMLIGEL
jgi:ribonuclease III